MKDRSGHITLVGTGLAALAMLGSFLLAGCISASPADVAAMENGLTAAEKVATAYTSLPVCNTPAVHPCADPVLKAKIKADDVIAYNAVMSLRANGGSVNLTAAQTAVAVLLADVPTK
jgi:hypothetical protein